MEKPTLSPDQLLPFERTGESRPEAEMGIFEQLGSDEPAHAADAEEPTPDEPASDEPEDEGDEPEEEGEDEGSDEDDSDDEPEEGGAEGKRVEEPQHFKVKVDGEELEVTLDELLQGYSRTADYTRKTTALAQEKAAELEPLRNARQQYSTLLEKLEKIVSDDLPPEPDWEKLRAEDPTGYAATYADYQRQVDRVRAVRAERERVAQEEYRDQTARWNARLEDEKKKLLAAVPEWGTDPEVPKKVAKYITSTYGYTEDDLNNTGDHRIIVAFRKAMLWDEQQAKGGKVLKEKVKGAKPVMKPGAKPVTVTSHDQPGKRKKVRRAMRQLAHSGRVADAAKVMENLFDD